MPTLAEALAAFALRSYAAGLPEAIFRQGGRAFVNWVGCAYGGCPGGDIAGADVACA